MNQNKIDAIAEAINSVSYAFCTQYGAVDDSRVVEFDVDIDYSATPTLKHICIVMLLNDIAIVKFYDDNLVLLSETTPMNIANIDLIKYMSIFFETLISDFIAHQAEVHNG